MRKIRLFYHFILNIQLIYKLIHQEAESIFAQILGTRFLVQEWCSNAANIINFHYRTNSEKINNQFSNKFKISNFAFVPFSDHLRNFFGKKYLPKNLALSHTTLYRFLTPCQNLEKTNNPLPRKRLHTLFHRTLLATAGGPKKLSY